MPRCRPLGGAPKPRSAAASPTVTALTDDIQARYGILISYRDVGELLDMASPTAINRWLREHGISAAGRRGYYYSRDVARAMIQHGGAI